MWRPIGRIVWRRRNRPTLYQLRLSRGTYRIWRFIFRISRSRERTYKDCQFNYENFQHRWWTRSNWIRSLLDRKKNSSQVIRLHTTRLQFNNIVGLNGPWALGHTWKLTFSRSTLPTKLSKMRLTMYVHYGTIWEKRRRVFTWTYRT